MNSTTKSKRCANHVSIERDSGAPFKNIANYHDCRDCVYFTSRNCGMDVADSIEPELCNM